MNIISITFEARDRKVYALARNQFTPSSPNVLILSDTRGGAPSHQWDVLGTYTVTNEAASASLIFAKIHGVVGTAGDTADIRNMIALLTQG